jgi:hypothetical protein
MFFAFSGNVAMAAKAIYYVQTAKTRQKTQIAFLTKSEKERKTFKNISRQQKNRKKRIMEPTMN